MKKISAHLALLSVALIYGANYTIAKEVLDPGYVKPIGFILLRSVAGVILFNLVRFAFVNEKVEKQDWKLIALCAFLGVFANQVPFFLGLKLTTAINASLLLTITPIIVLIAGAIILKEKITWSKALGILVGLTGAAYLILYAEAVSFSQDQLIGDLLVFLNSVSYGLYLVFVRKLMAKYSPITVLSRMYIFGFFMVLPFGYSEVAAVQWSELPTGIWLAVSYVLVFTTFLAYLLNAFALKRVSATIVSIYIYLQPILASAIAISYGKDYLTVDKVIAAALIFTGVFLVSKK